MGDASMPESLSDVLERLIHSKNKGGEFTVVAEERVLLICESCPEILLPVNKLSDIILVQRFSEHNKRLLSADDTDKLQNFLNDKNSSTPAPRGILSDDLDVTGSPLKCPFSLGEDISELSPFSVSLPFCKKSKKRESVSYTPLPASKSGLIASRFNIALQKVFREASESIPVWIVFDGNDAQGTLFFGLHYSNGEAIRTMVTSSGPWDTLECLPSLDHLKLHHFAACPTKMVNCSVKATYNVLFSVDECENSSVKLACTWNRPLNILAPPSLDAHTTACIKVVCSDQRSAAYHMYQELSILRGFVLGLSSGEVSWFVREEGCTVAEDLQKVFTIIKEKAQRQKKEEDGASDFDMMVEDKFYNRRQNMDFTDLLWSVLMKCESYQDLKLNLQCVFKAVALGQVRPQIHVRNKTQIGSLSRSLMRGQLEEPDLTGIIPLQMLVEIGIEKIKRDYINIFQAGELVTGDQLSWFVNNPDEKLEIMVDLLEKLHVGLQVFVILRTYLNLPQAFLAHFTALAFNQLKSSEALAPYTFNFNLETVKVHQFLNSISPTSWEVRLESNHEKYSKSLVTHISQQPLIKFGSNNSDFEEMLEDKDKSEEEEDRYYCGFFTTVKDQTFL